jgi:hypothetical protein
VKGAALREKRKEEPMTETLETAITTELALDYDIPIDIELSSDILVEIDPDINPEWLSADFEVTTGYEYWPGEIYVLVVPYPSPDAQTPVVSDPV